MTVKMLFQGLRLADLFILEKSRKGMSAHMLSFPWITYKDVKILFGTPYMVYDDFDDVKEYLGDGKWKAEVCDYAGDFSRELTEARGYQFDYNDYHLGADYYSKIVGYESFIAVDIPMHITERDRPSWDTCVRVDVPDCLRDEMEGFMIVSGSICFEENIARKLIEYYTLEKLMKLQKKQCRIGQICSQYMRLHSNEGYRYVGDCFSEWKNPEAIAKKTAGIIWPFDRT